MNLSRKPTRRPRIHFLADRNILAKLKYQNSVADGVDDLGGPKEIRSAFTGFQKYLYQRQAGT